MKTVDIVALIQAVLPFVLQLVEFFFSGPKRGTEKKAVATTYIRAIVPEASIDLVSRMIDGTVALYNATSWTDVFDTKFSEDAHGG